MFRHAFKPRCRIRPFILCQGALLAAVYTAAAAPILPHGCASHRRPDPGRQCATQRQAQRQASAQFRACKPPCRIACQAIKLRTSNDGGKAWPGPGRRAGRPAPRRRRAPRSRPDPLGRCARARDIPIPDGRRKFCNFPFLLSASQPPIHPRNQGTSSHVA